MIAARAFEDAHIDLPAVWRERNREIEFDAQSRNALHPREFSALTKILPWLRDHQAADWLLQHVPEGDGAEIFAEASGAPSIATEA